MTDVINKRSLFLIRWSPLFFLTAITWAVLAWRHQPMSWAYLAMCVAVGLVCGALIIVNLRKDGSPLFFVLWYMVFISAPTFIAAVLYSDYEGKMNYRYMSAVVASVLGLMVVFRHRLMKLPVADAEQIVGREPR